MIKMVEELDLKKLERKVYTSYFQDGLTDILLGLIFIVMGFVSIIRTLTSVITSYVLIALILAGMFILFILSKKYITLLRIGKVKFSKERKAYNIKAILITVLFLISSIIILTFLIKDGNYIGEFATMVGPLVMGLLLFTIPFSIMAYFLQFNRLYLVGVLTGFSEVFIYLFSAFMELSLAICFTFSIIGGIILSWGIVIFIRFILKYPIPKEEEMA